MEIEACKFKIEEPIGRLYNEKIKTNIPVWYKLNLFQRLFLRICLGFKYKNYE